MKSTPSKQDEQQVPSSFEWEDGQRNWRMDDQQSELASMSLLDVFSPALLNGSNVPQNMPNEQPRRMENPSTRSVHQAPKTGELNEEIRG